MKNHEFVMSTNNPGYLQLVRERRVSFVRALMEECRLLQQRIDQEKVAMAPGVVEFVWDGSVYETCLPPASASIAALAELNAVLGDLSKMDYILNDVAVQVGADTLACGNML